MSTDDHGPSGVSDRPVTFEAAEELGGFELARQWADRASWPWPGKETARDHLAELAYMSALAAWLRRWQPIHIHGALLAGARLDDVAAALGASVEEAFRRWHEWASRQRELAVSTERLWLGEEEYEAVVRRFAAVGFVPDMG